MISRTRACVLCCKNRQQAADTKRTHQKRHARRLPTHLTRPHELNLQEKTESLVIARVRAVTTQNLHGKEGVDGSSPSEGFDKPLQIGAFFSLFVA